jgi:ankyrin repeat protein
MKRFDTDTNIDSTKCKMRKMLSKKKIILIVALAVAFYFVIYAPLYTMLLNTFIWCENIPALNIVLFLPGDKNRNNEAPLMEYWGATPLGTAVESADNPEIVRLLIEKGADVNNRRTETPLNIACGSDGENRYEIVRILVENGTDVNWGSDEYAYENYHTPLVKTFHHNREWHNNISVEMNTIEKEQLIEKDREINYTIMLYLINNGADLRNTVTKRELLDHTVTNGNIPAVEYLLETGLYDVNGSIEYPGGPLDQAAFNGYIEVAKYLLEHGADPMVVMKNGETVLEDLKESWKGNMEYYKDLKPFIELYDEYAQKGEVE